MNCADLNPECRGSACSGDGAGLCAKRWNRALAARGRSGWEQPPWVVAGAWLAFAGVAVALLWQGGAGLGNP